MSETKPNAGKKFFDHGDQVAETGNWDFAIEMYAEGLQREPDNMKRGWEKLREVGMKRLAQGGKPAGGKDKKSHKMGKDDQVNLANAGFLWAKAPGNIDLMRQVLEMADKAGQGDVVRWMGDLMIQALSTGQKKPNKFLCVKMTDILERATHYDLAIRACQLAHDAAPNDAAIESRIGELGAKYTIKQGKYGQEGDFTKGVADMDKQKELMEKDATFKSDEYLQTQIKKAKHEYEASPTVPGKVNALVDALLALEDDRHDAAALGVLKKAFTDTKMYQFKMRMGDVQIRQMSRHYRLAVETGDKDAAVQIRRQQLVFEVQEFAERAKNYPTDLGIKYELGRRLFMVGKFDEAISALQQASRDPRRQVACMNYLGMSFMKKQWWQEAIDTFDRVLQHDMGDRAAKEIRYNLADACEQLGTQNNDLQLLRRSEEGFSDVAQIDFNYKDVRERLESVRAKIKAVSS